MQPRHGALTARDELRIITAHAAAWLLDALARAGEWDAYCDGLNDRLGTLGLGRN